MQSVQFRLGKFLLGGWVEQNVLRHSFVCAIQALFLASFGFYVGKHRLFSWAMLQKFDEFFYFFFRRFKIRPRLSLTEISKFFWTYRNWEILEFRGVAMQSVRFRLGKFLLGLSRAVRCASLIRLCTIQALQPIISKWQPILSWRHTNSNPSGLLQKCETFEKKRFQTSLGELFRKQLCLISLKLRDSHRLNCGL